MEEEKQRKSANEGRRKRPKVYLKANPNGSARKTGMGKKAPEVGRGGKGIGKDWEDHMQRWPKVG